ncbi:MAG: hypothetical protein ACLFTT_03650 [Candidatus Hydrogenedentota bacterium]
MFSRGKLLCILSLVCVFSFGACSTCRDNGRRACPAPEVTGKASESEESPAEKRWYATVGASNYHPGLEESELKIERQLNQVFDWLPFWERPETFKDWRDSFKLWDMAIGVGRDLTPRTTWMIWTGGAKGTIENNKRYGPLDTDITFSRTTAFFTIQGYWFPWGKTDYTLEEKDTGRVQASLRGAKPYFSVGTGWCLVRAEADAKFKVPILGTVLHQTDKEDHHLFQVSPCFGVEIPVTKNNNIIMEGSYYFFGPDHQKEYNGPAMFLGFKHRF